MVKTNYDVRSHDTQVSLYSHRDMFRLRKWLLSQYFKLMATPKKEQEQTVDDLCTHTGVSRRTLYKWKKRYMEEGDAGLYDRSRKPKRMHHTPAFIVSTIYDVRERFGWGD
ncbi:MAG: helix-turn-helix domain-containing protein [Candidatus Odinarchaeota archaeon]|nr:helix-turn-helix domain-containing protein [Candidatus Odinarchaeota archaeon]